MPEYDFHTLSPTDFELLARDLLQEHLGVELHAFARGPDGGVDLRGHNDGKTTVAQCKHYHGSSFSDLKRAARAEKKNMDSVKPSSYFFVTTQDLTKGQKEELQGILTPHIADIQQILAMKELNQLLDQYPHVEQNHFKLWMASSTVLKRIVESGIWRRSEALMEDIQDRVRLYVVSSSFAKARQLLADGNVCVITGAPGVGKSMLADMLALWRWEAKWQIVELPSHKIDEAWSVWENDTKQFFYFDDVFGQTDIRERLSTDSGTTIGRLIYRVNRSEGLKNLVITTRTHVLNEAEARDEALQRAGLHARECVLEVAEYSRVQKARILYNHLYFSDLPRDTVREFATRNLYWPIIKHANFTPRLIELTIRQHPVDGSTDDLSERMIHALDHPIDLWGNSFREALTEPARTLLMHLVAFPPNGAPMEALRDASKRDASPIAYTSAIGQLEGSWITVVAGESGSNSFVSFHNPSCRDFVLSFLDAETDYYVDVLMHSGDSAQLTQFLQYAMSTAAGSKASKYPAIRSRVEALRTEIMSLLDRLWPVDPERVARRSVELLVSLSRLNESLELELSDWILGQIFLLSQRVMTSSSVDGTSASILAEFLMRNIDPPTTVEHTESCKILFLAWCNSVGEYSEWDNVFEFREWIGTDVEWTDTEQSLIEKSFDSWLDSEFEAILDNAEDADSARTWVEDSVRTANRYFGDDAFESRFDDFESSVVHRFEDYEPSGEDVDSARAGDAIESSGRSLADILKSRTESEDAQVRGLFDQLG